MPVQESMEYELTFDYRTSGIAAGAGLSWRITSQGGEVNLNNRQHLFAEHETTGRVLFATPAGCHIARLALAYGRTPGTPRVEGFIVLRKTALQPAARTAD
jgi:hypothetical protein